MAVIDSRWFQTLAVAAMLGALALAAAPSAHATAIEGTVRDAGGDPIPWAQVLLQPVGRGVIADENGRFRFGPVAPGEYELQITHVSYRDTKIPVDVAAEGVARPEIQLVQDSFRMETVRIRARTLDQSDTVTKIEMERKDLVSYQPVTVVDALETVPGVEVVKTGAWSARPSIRGMSGDRVLVSVDGVRMNQVRGHGAEPSLIPVDALESVEVAVGAGGVRHGSSALGGNLNLVTRRPLVFDGRRLELSALGRMSAPGGGQSISGRARILTPNGGLEFGAGGGRLDALVTPDGELPKSGNREDHWMARASWMSNSAALDVQHFRSNARDVGLPAFQTSAGGDAQYPLKARESTRLELQLDEAPFFPASVVLADYQKYRSHFDETVVDSVFRNQRFRALITTDNRDRITSSSTGFTTEHEHSLLPGLKLSTEFRFEDTEGGRTTFEVVANSSGDVTSETESLGESMPPSDRLSGALALTGGRSFGALRVEGGWRWDSVQSNADSSLVHQRSPVSLDESRHNGELGVSWETRSWQPYARVATAFRVPNLDERFFDGFVHGALYLFGNPELRPERAVSSEVGLRWRDLWGGRMPKGRLSVYQSNVEDMITFEYASTLYLVPRFQYRNVENARVYGVEGSCDFAFGDFGLRANGVLPRSYDTETDERIPDAGTARANFEMSWNGWQNTSTPARLSVRWKWADALTDVDENLSSPAFWTTDAELRLGVLGTECTVSVRNLTDRTYRQSLSLIEEPGRTWAVSLRRALAFNLSS